MTVTRRGVVIPDSALSWKFSRSSGAGGQHVNTTDTRVELMCDLEALRGGSLKLERIRTNLGSRVRVVESSRRSQLLNRRAAIQKLVELIDANCLPERHRRSTKPTRSSIESRLESKKLRSRIKQERSSRSDQD